MQICLYCSSAAGFRLSYLLQSNFFAVENIDGARFLCRLVIGKVIDNDTVTAVGSSFNGNFAGTETGFDPDLSVFAVVELQQ